MADKARHAFGSLSSVEAALQAGKIDVYDILFLDGETEPKVGWIDKNGVFRLVENETDLSGVEAELATKANVSDVESLGSQIATKADAAAVAELEVEIANKADVTTVQTMIKEHSAAIEVVEF